MKMAETPAVSEGLFECDLPQGWAWASIDKVCSKVQDGTHFSPKEQARKGKFKYVTAKNIKVWGLDLTDVTYVSEQVHREIFERCNPEKGDVLYIKDGATTGVATVNPLAEEFSLLSSVALLKPYRECMDPYFLKWYLNSPPGFRTMTDQMTGCAITRIILKTIRKSPVPVAPLAEQTRIVAKVEALLARVNTARERLAKVPVILKRFRQSILAAACSGQLTADWRESHAQSADLEASRRRSILDSLCSGFQYGTSAKSSAEGKVPVLRMGNIQDGSIDWSDLVFTSDNEEIGKYSLQPRTVLFNRTNSPELVGKTAIYRGERPAIFAGYLIRILHGDALNPEYLNYCLNAPEFREYCGEVKSDGVSQSNINARKLAAYEIPYCHPAEQQEIVRRVEALFALADAIEARVQAATARVEKITQAILAKAFRGELVPTEAELARQESRDYEPASVLLERIRADRAVNANDRDGLARHRLRRKHNGHA
jgi:type I restriction enzyme S subunit